MIGYRDDSIYGSGCTNPFEVVDYEMRILGNVDIPATILQNNKFSQLSDEDRSFLLKCVKNENYSIDNQDRATMFEILKKILDGKDYCKWLCKTREDVFDAYVYGSSCEAMYDMNNIVEYVVPDDHIILSDLGSEGALYCWKQNSGPGLDKPGPTVSLGGNKIYL